MIENKEKEHYQQVAAATILRTSHRIKIENSKARQRRSIEDDDDDQIETSNKAMRRIDEAEASSEDANLTHDKPDIAPILQSLFQGQTGSVMVSPSGYINPPGSEAAQPEPYVPKPGTITLDMLIPPSLRMRPADSRDLANSATTELTRRTPVKNLSDIQARVVAVTPHIDVLGKFFAVLPYPMIRSVLPEHTCLILLVSTIGVLVSRKIYSTRRMRKKRQNVRKT
ncbi:hypothetical protein BDV95DRAFT_596524 [Massariosphaeria phaeospora]|uniref:Uncharacterized protein n=1 Tax=Massariosphaeria phaeospora TaxID=100035 RepID=A0A7C8M5W3_9PLEO|nr:hypothetical protein BDV95DRAFT_596524 [Massariosphaeria phaeospora]